MKATAALALLALTICLNKAVAQVNVMTKQYAWPENAKPPVAPVKPKELIAHGDKRIDNYYWMNDYFKKGPDSNIVIQNLKEENAYFDAMMAGTSDLQQGLYEEMKARIKEKDESVPVFNRGYYYYSRQIEGKDYFLYCRKKGSLEAAEEILLDVNAMAEGHQYFSVAGFDISLDNNLLAYAVDTRSRRQYTIQVKNLVTGETYADAVIDTEGDPVWAADNKTFFYTAKNPVTLLSEKIKRHQLGDAVDKDPVVYEEKDPSNYISLDRTKSNAYITITSTSTLSAEVWLLPSNKPMSAFTVFQPRMKNVLYSVNHANGQFFIRTNHEARNFKIMSCAEQTTGISNWKTLQAHSDKILVGQFDCFKDYLAVSERSEGLTRIHLIHLKDQQSHYIQFDEATYAAGMLNTPDYLSESLRFSYTSLTTPATVYDYDMRTRTKTLKKQQEVLGGFDSEQYKSERLYAKATDGTLIPISLVYKKGFNKNGQAPLLLYGYGSYGNSIDASFSSVRLSLLDRGFCYAIAHIRGGQEMGRYWYEDGKLMKKKNTFTDFIDCAEMLVKEKYCSPQQLYAAGGSAGGLLMGAVVNMRPDLWKGVLAAVPFVDVVTTMSDPSIPLTTNEYDEWGNPANKDSYFYMKSYSPYDNVQPRDYPNMLVTTGLHDSQVQYFEPQKWVASLRVNQKGKGKILFHTDMEAGHGGASGRFKALRDRAREYAFLLLLQGIHR